MAADSVVNPNQKLTGLDFVNDMGDTRADKLDLVFGLGEDRALDVRMVTPWKESNESGSYSESS